MRTAKPVKTREIELGDRLGTEQELAQLATLRNLSTESLLLAQNAGLLRFGRWKGLPAWFVIDEPAKVAQARRMDGKEWISTDPKKEPFKSWTICSPGNGSWPLGASFIGNRSIVAFCEGGPDALAAYHFAYCERVENSVVVVCMLGTGMKQIHEKALPLFRGKFVRLFLDCDNSGLRAGVGWAAQLKQVGATVDWFDLSGLRKTNDKPAKDLNDICSVDADDFEQRRDLWNLMEVENG